MALTIAELESKRDEIIRRAGTTGIELEGGGTRQKQTFTTDEQATLDDGSHGISGTAIGATEGGIEGIGGERTDQLKHGFAVKQKGGLGGGDGERG